MSTTECPASGPAVLMAGKPLCSYNYCTLNTASNQATQTKDTAFSNISAIGNLTATWATVISVSNSNLTGMECSSYSPMITSMYVSAFAVTASSKHGNWAWPPKIDTLYAISVPTKCRPTRRKLTATNLASLPPNLPSTITSLYDEATCLHLFDNIHSSTSNTPLTALQPLPSIDALSIVNSSLISIANQPWARLTRIVLHSNAQLTSLVNVTLSPSLAYLSLKDVHLTTFTVDAKSFAALSSLTDAGRLVSLQGVTITSSDNECLSNRGTITPLWPTLGNYSACVVGVSTKPDAPTADASSSMVWVIGIVVGAVVILGAAFGALWWWRRRRQQVPPTLTGSSRDVVENNLVAPLKSDRAKVQMHESEGYRTLAMLNRLRLDASSLVRGRLLGTGAHAQVYHGMYNATPVAIKSLVTKRKHDIDMIIDEIELLAALDSPYIVQLVGASWAGRIADLEIVLEYMDMGDLHAYLHTHDVGTYPWSQKRDVVANVAMGLAYLHERSIIHRDVKARNVLLDSTKGTKLTDFGVSKIDVQATMTIGVGTYRWMAPEVLQENRYTIAADVYSFGVLMSEVDTHQIPYLDMIQPETGNPLMDTAILARVVQGTLRPTFSEMCPTDLAELAHRCLAFNPADRPTAVDIVTSLLVAAANLAAASDV
ncbi:protein kinase [Achlya hypogyna]|uniref:Protein kinase n=1 Tax=Achlya hypogyna TaxID=1202772 RepID=A0A1V9Z5V5_ACHHY|nr:protein kinase [Achlya hypogyna]